VKPLPAKAALRTLKNTQTELCGSWVEVKTLLERSLLSCPMRGLHTLARDGASEETAALLAAPGLRSSLVLRQAEAVEEAVQRAELVDTRVTPGYRHARGAIEMTTLNPYFTLNPNAPR